MPVSPEESSPSHRRRPRLPLPRWKRGSAHSGPQDSSSSHEFSDPARTSASTGAGESLDSAVPAYAPEPITADDAISARPEAAGWAARHPMGKAHIVRTVDRAADERGGYAVSLYRLEPPTSVWAQQVSHVLVVGRWAPEGMSTTIHMATEEGRMALTCEMPGSFTGAVDHIEALRRLGYLVTL